MLIDGDNATCSCYLHAQHTLHGTEGGDNYVMAGRYVDKLIRVGTEWRIVERELILKQLLFLRQDVNDLKRILLNDNSTSTSEVEPSNPALYLPMDGDKDNYNSNSINIDDGTVKGVKDSAVGELTLEEIEQEVIEKTLKKFNLNRRKTAKALNISERTLYRKINEYGMDKKRND